MAPTKSTGNLNESMVSIDQLRAESSRADKELNDKQEVYRKYLELVGEHARAKRQITKMNDLLKQKDEELVTLRANQPLALIDVFNAELDKRVGVMKQVVEAECQVVTRSISQKLAKQKEESERLRKELETVGGNHRNAIGSGNASFTRGGRNNAARARQN